jgi:hypothetical protein
LDYRKAPPTGYALARSPLWGQALNYAYQIDPTYDEKEYPTRAKMMMNYTSGQPSSAGGQINAINTVLGHAGVLADAIDALNNDNIQLLNRIATQWKIQIGKDAPTTFKAIVNRVGPELTRAYVGTGGEQAEREINKSDFSTSMSPTQLINNIGVTVRLLRSKIGSLENQYLNTMKKDDFSARFMMPEAQRVIDRFNGDGTTVNPFIINLRETYDYGPKRTKQ